jgi:DNA invertase Pin-like site-specific DNA recombinase
VDHGVSGSKDRRPALDEVVKDAKRRKFDVLICWRLDRLGRNLRHLVSLVGDLQALGIAFVSLGEGIDCTTPAGKLQLHILAALAEFERERIRERVICGLHRARAQGKRLGRQPYDIPLCASRRWRIARCAMPRRHSVLVAR